MRPLFCLGRRTWLLLTLGVVAGMIFWKIVDLITEPSFVPDPARVRAWDKVAGHLRQAEDQDAQAAEQHLRRIDEFFAEKQTHARDFADDVLSLSGKWAFLRGKLPWIGDGGETHQAYLRAAFERHLFSGTDLQNAVQAAISAYLSALEGQENALLVTIRADLSAEELPGLSELAALRSDEAFHAEYRQLLTEIIPIVSRDLKIAIGREVVVWVGSDIAAAITMRIGSAVAVRLGLSGGILSTGAASGTVTLGVGLAAGSDGVAVTIRPETSPAMPVTRSATSAPC
jgi:hypothetical protein